MRKIKSFISVLLTFALVLTATISISPSRVRADEGAKLNIFLRDSNGSVEYKINDEGDFKDSTTITADGDQRWITGLSAGNTVTFKAKPNDGKVIDPNQTSIGSRGSGNNLTDDQIAALLSETGFSYTIPNEGDFELEIAFCNENSSGDGGGEGGEGIHKVPMDSDFTVSVAGTRVFDNSKGNNEKISVSDDASYTVEVDDWGQVAIIPKEIPDFVLGETPAKDISIGCIKTSGQGTVCINTGLSIDTPDGPSSHIEEDFNVTIEADTTTSEMYSFNSTDGKAELIISNGNTRCSAIFEGGINANNLTIGDIGNITIGKADEDNPVKVPVGIRLSGKDSTLEVADCQMLILAEIAFIDIDKYLIHSDADITVDSTKLFNDQASELISGGYKKYIRVQTGGKIRAFSDGSDAANKIDMSTFDLEAGYYTDYGQILQIERVNDRMEDLVKRVKCVEGDHSLEAGRYIYEVFEANFGFKLESTTSTYSSLGYSFDPNSGDQYVENGHFEVSAGCGLQDTTVENGGEFFFEAGTEVKFKLVPDAGYKYVQGSFCYNDSNSEDQIHSTDDPGVYTITMPDTNVHVSCKFTKADNEVSVAAAKTVSSASVTIPDGVVKSGTATFAAKDATLTDSQKNSFGAVAGDSATIGATLDLSLSQDIDKIGTKEKWSTPITELSSEMTVSVVLDDSLAGQSDYSVIREHDGKTEKLSASYDATSKTLTFKTDKFSTYAIAYQNATTETAIPAAGEKINVTDKKASYVSNGDGTVSYSATKKASKKVKIPDTVTDADGNTYKVTIIAANAFKGNKKVTQIIVGNNVTTIGKNAFSGCTKLTKVTLGKKVKKISANAFKGCKKLKTVTISSSSLKKAGIKNAFKGSSVTSVKVPKKMVAKYKKIFTKAVVGKKIKVKAK